MAQSILQNPTGIGPKKEIHDLEGRVALVTGGALGIGEVPRPNAICCALTEFCSFEVSRAFAHHKARVIMVNRKEEQGDAAVKQLKDELGENAPVEWIPCDMGDLEQVREVFSGIREREQRLDLLVLSAGINVNQNGETNDGIDRHFQVNWVGQFYVFNKLYPLLRKTSKLPDAPAPRIVWESSEMHRTAPSTVHFGSIDEINDPSVVNTELYGRTKLAIILGVKYGLLERVIKPNQDKIYALSVHPGAVNTAMQQQWKDAYPGLTGKLLSYAMLSIGRDVEQGSFSALYAATSPEVEEKQQNGWYFSDPGQPGKETSQASDLKLGAALWDLTERIIKDKAGEDAIIPWNT